MFKSHLNLEIASYENYLKFYKTMSLSLSQMKANNFELLIEEKLIIGASLILLLIFCTLLYLKKKYSPEHSIMAETTKEKAVR